MVSLFVVVFSRMFTPHSDVNTPYVATKQTMFVRNRRENGMWIEWIEGRYYSNCVSPDIDNIPYFTDMDSSLRWFNTTRLRICISDHNRVRHTSKSFHKVHSSVLVYQPLPSASPHSFIPQSFILKIFEKNVSGLIYSKGVKANNLCRFQPCPA